jgi:hypothetical protein
MGNSTPTTDPKNRAERLPGPEKKTALPLVPARALQFALAAVMLLAAAASAAEEAQLIAVLQSDAGQKEKADACRELAHVGARRAVPALAALLGDEKLSHMARYALEPIPDPAVERRAPRTPLSKVKGRPLLGVIGSLGVRRDAKAVDALAGLLASADSGHRPGSRPGVGQHRHAPGRQGHRSGPSTPPRPPPRSTSARGSSAAPKPSPKRGSLRRLRRSSTASAAARARRSRFAPARCGAQSSAAENRASR